jgi:hypothetical protein
LHIFELKNFWEIFFIILFTVIILTKNVNFKNQKNMIKLNKEHFLTSLRTNSTFNDQFHHEKCSKTLKKA